MPVIEQSGAVDIESGKLTAENLRKNENRNVGEAVIKDDEHSSPSEDGDDYEDDGRCCSNSQSRLRWFKFTINVILPLTWIGGGGWFARDFFLIYSSDDDTKWADAGGADYNDVDRSIIFFCITAMVLLAASLLCSAILLYLKRVALRKYLEITVCACIAVMGIVFMFALGGTSNEFYYSYLNGWAIATVTFAGFLLVYHITVYIDYMCPCCCRGEGCCDWNYKYAEETESELDRLESLGIKLDGEDKRDENQTKQLESEYAAKMKRRAEKKDRRKQREVKRKERRKRKAEKFRQEREEWETQKKNSILYAIKCW